MSEKDEYQQLVIAGLPPAIQLAFSADPIAAGTAGLISSVGVAAYKIFREKNADWAYQCLTNADAVFLLQDAIRAPEHLQYFRELFTKVAYESREEKRKALLCAARNYRLKDGELSFDMKMEYLSMLDSLSEFELIYLLGYYGKIPFTDDIAAEAIERKIPEKLAALGMIDTDYSSISESMNYLRKRTEEALQNTAADLKSLRESLDEVNMIAGFGGGASATVPEINPSSQLGVFRHPEIEFKRNKYGENFATYVTLCDISENV